MLGFLYGEKMATENIIKIKDVTFTYPDTKQPAIDNIGFNIKRGTWTAIIGHNGSGKSTIIRLINGLLVPDNPEEASIEVDGVELNNNSVWDIRNKVGIVFQNPDNQFVGATVADDVAFGLENRGVPREEMLKIVPEAINAVGMADYTNSEPSSLSGGQKQRVAIAGIIAIKPKIIILDEATSMLDPEGRNKILQIVHQMKKEYDLTVISITHDIDEASLADQVIVMNDGKLIDQGSSSKIFSQTTLLKRLGLDVPFFEQVKDMLLERNINFPKTVNSEKELINFLCQLNSNK
ncbi:energy-coupling factor ABC transporter ATP-binding protein [Lactobacillus sp. ESL0677]|nr:energy-coupling factor ABC transporter ATP-binding protein [Lactobacillus sp. ESL0677]WEV36612.1 energy-coupling factor ABC transporter ATP-binding protein [Lactobacillus sp. ESL0677]